jgi:hypothetical protein
MNREQKRPGSAQMYDAAMVPGEDRRSVSLFNDLTEDI